MFYIVYKITNLINNKIYIGCHKTKNINDSYMGSGIALKNAQKKHGINNFTKEILSVLDNIDEMFELEKELVNSDFVKRNDTYNLKEGGKNWDYLSSIKARQKAIENGFLEKSKQRIQWLRENDQEWNISHGRNISKSLKLYYKSNDSPFKGKKHSKETKDIISRKNKISHSGSLNSQFNKVWVSNLELKIAYRIDSAALEEELKKDNIVKMRILNFDKYFNKINIKDKKDEDLKKIDIENKIFYSYLIKIKQENNLISVRELHLFLIKRNLYFLSGESLRLFMNKYKKM